MEAEVLVRSPLSWRMNTCQVFGVGGFLLDELVFTSGLNRLLLFFLYVGTMQSHALQMGRVCRSILSRFLRWWVFTVPLV